MWYTHFCRKRWGFVIGALIRQMNRTLVRNTYIAFLFLFSGFSSSANSAPKFSSCPVLARAVVSSYVLRIFSLSIAYEEYTKNIRRNYDPGKTRTGGKYGRGECRHEQRGEREQETLCKDFGLKADSFIVPA